MHKMKLTALLITVLVSSAIFSSCDQKDSKSTETTMGTDVSTAPAPAPVIVKDTVVARTFDTTAKSRPLKPGN